MKVYVLWSRWLCLFAGLLAGCGQEAKEVPSIAYTIESIETPDGLLAETGGLDFLPDGRLVACFQRGEVMFYDPESREWSLFAYGLQEPLGLMVVSEWEILVMQRGELTRLRDTDRDGKADHYETVTDQFGFSGNFHEYSYGPVRDKSGSLFFAISCPAGGTIMPEVRGRLDTTVGILPGQYSVAPYQGWVMKITEDCVLEPYASGFRSQNGIGFDLSGNLLVSDNQGDWIGTSTLYHVKEGNFYGHPASLIWKDGWNRGNPFELPVAELDSMRTRAAVLFPHGMMAASPTQPVCDATGGKFGPFDGQVFIGEMNSERIIRVMMEEVDGELQGACIPFFDGNGLRKGNNRLAFAPDGSLWVGQNAHGWPGDVGIQRLVFTGRQPMDVQNMTLTPDGFKLEFTQPISSGGAEPGNYRFRRYYYKYHKGYGSPPMELQDIPVTGSHLSADGKVVTLALESMRPGFVYELTLGQISSQAGDTLTNKLVCYTLNRLKK